MGHVVVVGGSTVVGLVWCGGGVEVVLDGCGGGVWGEVGSHGHGGLGISNLERMDKKKYHKFW